MSSQGLPSIWRKDRFYTGHRGSFSYFDVDAHIVELIPNSASDAFKAHLRSVGASYLIAGEETLDMEIAARRIGEVFGVDELILGGGGTLNWSMVRDGLCNEVSIVMMPLADGETDTASLFEARACLPNPDAVSARLGPCRGCSRFRMPSGL